MRAHLLIPIVASAIALGAAVPAGAGDFGADDESAVADTTAFPHSAACRLRMISAEGGHYSCSGTLVGSHHVLTAGHCVSQEEHGGWMEEVWVAPAYDNGAMPFYEAQAVRMHALQGWLDSESWLHDMALVAIDRRLGDHAGYLEMGYFEDDADYVGLIVESDHYPGDPIDDTQTMYHSSDEVAHADEYALGHYLDTAGGSSGAGLYLDDGEEPTLLAVNAWFFGELNNYAPRINEERMAWIEQKMGSDPVPIDAADLTPAPCDAHAGVVEMGVDSFDVLLGVINRGTQPSGEVTLDVYFSEDHDVTHNDQFVARVTLPAIDALDRAEDTFTLDVPADLDGGYHYLGVVVDLDDTVEEIDESDQSVACEGSILLVPPGAGGDDDDDDTPADDDDDDDGGDDCSCSADGAGAGGAPALVGLAAALLGIRRRRRA